MLLAPNRFGGFRVVPPDIQYHIAATRADRAAAFRLVYDSYLHAGLGERNPYRMRVTPYHLQDNTEIFIAERRRKVIFTMSLVVDNPELGLPMESVYGEEVQRLRDQGLRLGEVTCLADCQRNFRDFFAVFLYTSRLMVQYARVRGLDALVAAVHPKHARFYRRYMDFFVFGLERTYPTVRNHPAMALWLEFARIDQAPPACYDFFFGRPIPADELRPQPISWEDRDYFGPMVDENFLCVPLADAEEYEYLHSEKPAANIA